MSARNIREYSLELLTRWHELQLSMIEFPAFNVLDIWRTPNGNVCVMVDDLRAVEEVGDYDECGHLMYMGAEWVKKGSDDENCDDNKG